MIPSQFRNPGLKAFPFRCIATNVLIIIIGAFIVFGATADDQAHFHHVRLNVQDVAATQAFYQKVFGATPVQFNNKTPGLFTERSFILMNVVNKPARVI